MAVSVQDDVFFSILLSLLRQFRDVNYSGLVVGLVEVKVLYDCRPFFLYYVNTYSQTEVGSRVVASEAVYQSLPYTRSLQ